MDIGTGTGEILPTKTDSRQYEWLTVFFLSQGCGPSESISRKQRPATHTDVRSSDFADDFPSAEVIGTDISPIQPPWTAPNCRFEMEDAEQEWTFSLNSFDYIHMRTLNGSIQDWNKLFQQSFDTLRPGGWIETYESECVFGSDNCELPDDSPLKLWSEYFHEAGKRMSRTFHVLSENVQVEGIRAAGFRNIKVVPLRVSFQPLPDIDPAAAASGK